MSDRPIFPRQNFNPEMTARFGRPAFAPDVLVKYSPKWEHARLMNFPHRGRLDWRPRMRSVVIAVDGAARGNNSANPASRAAYGVFFGRNCKWNSYGTVDQTKPQTNSRAELQAVREALLTVLRRRQLGELTGWREIIVQTDSEYVAKSLSEYIWSWQLIGWRTIRGDPVKHLELIKEIHNMICHLEERGAVRFWRISREFNTAADALANRALNEHMGQRH